VHWADTLRSAGVGRSERHACSGSFAVGGVCGGAGSSLFADGRAIEPIHEVLSEFPEAFAYGGIIQRCATAIRRRTCFSEQVGLAGGQANIFEPVYVVEKSYRVKEQ
jgi:hypothetical protein